MRGTNDGGIREPGSAAIAQHAVDSAAARGTAQVASCPSCGAGVGRHKRIFALCCRSCGAFLMPRTDQAEREQPDALVAFACDEAAARAAFGTWISSRRLAPRALVKGERQVRAIDAVFLPFWSYSADTRSTYIGKRGVNETRLVPRTRTDAQGNTETTLEPESYTEWHTVSGAVGEYFDAIVVPGCSPLSESLPPWPLDALIPGPQYGPPDRRVIAYDVDPRIGFERAKAEMDEQIEREVRAQIGGEAQRVGSISTDYGAPAYSLLLFPAYLISYAHEGRTYSALVNGASGTVAGERPYSPVKIAILIAMLAAIAAAIIVMVTRH